MRLQTLDRFKALILILMAMFFADKLVSGRLYYYIGPRFSWLSVVAVALLIILAGSYNLVGARRERSEHNYNKDEKHETGNSSLWPLMVIALPLILGTLIPARPLGASAISTRGIATDVAVDTTSGGGSLMIASAQRNVLDWVRAISANPDPAALDGQQADVIGFVYRDIRFGKDQFMLARFAITCCVADAMAIGVVVQAGDAAQFPNDSWVRVQGSFAAGTLSGQAIPVLMADEVAPIQPPEQPYLYP